MEDRALSEGLGGRVAKGALWLASMRFAASLLGFVSMIVVARLLAPEDFGLVAVGVTAMQLLSGVSDIGVSQAVVRFRDTNRADLDTLFTISVVRGVSIAFILAAAGPVAAALFSEPRLVLVFLAAAAQPVFAGLTNPRFHEFERAIDFSKEFARVIAAKLASVAVSIAVAVALGNYWAILLGLAAGAAVQLILSYAMVPYAPRLSLASWRKVMGFSGWLAGVGFLAALNNKTDAFILVRLLGPAGAGMFYYGCQLADLPTREFATQIARAIYPGLSALQGEAVRMRAAFLRGVEALGAVAMPASIGFAFVARDFIDLFLGAKWEGAVPVVEILTPVLGVQALFLATQYYAMALGRTRLVFFRELIYLIVRFPPIIWATATHGLRGAVSAIAALGIVHVALNLTVYAQASGRSFFEPLVAARRSLCAVVVMAAYFIVLRPAIVGLADAPTLFRLALDIAAGASVYLTALGLLWRLEGAPAGVERDAFGAAAAMLAKARRA